MTPQIDTRIKQSALWASLMACFIYCDYFGLFIKGNLMKMNDGLMGPLGQATPQIMFVVSIMMIIPSVMIALSVVLRPKFGTLLNLIFSTIYIIIMIISSMGAEKFYILFATVEICLLLMIFFISFKSLKAQKS